MNAERIIEEIKKQELTAKEIAAKYGLTFSHVRVIAATNGLKCKRDPNWGRQKKVPPRPTCGK